MANAIYVASADLGQQDDERVDVASDVNRDDKVELESTLQSEIDSKGRVTNLEDTLDIGTSLDRQAGHDRSSDDARFAIISIGLLLVHPVTVSLDPVTANTAVSTPFESRSV
ncbi:hypothetical protein ACFWAD_23860 [Rhodococcus sp. NPDC059969]|uniref:hypothetical protein n=1 Tax=Rhodococcus sp. NPDC059969 TaxID=3347018 RepID=UPI00366BF3A9